MIYLPIAAQILPPFAAVTTLVVKGIVAPLIHVPRALRDGQPGDVIRLVLSAAVFVPVGVWVLSAVHADVFRWGVSLIALGMLAALILGIRYRGVITNRILFGAGATGGFLAGSAGLPGPPVIMLYMASVLPSQAIRANITLYLIMADGLIIAVLWWNGYLAVSAVALGGLMIAPYFLGNWLGASMFRPGHETLYRRVAYAIIAVSAVMGLPIWRD